MQVNGPEEKKLARKKSLAVSEAYVAVHWPTPGFKGTSFKLCVLNRWDFNFCVRSSPLRRAWSVLQAVLYAVLAAWSSGYASKRLRQERFFSSSSWISFSASSKQSWCFLVERPRISAVIYCNMVFICFHCSSGSTAVTQWSLSSNMTWRLCFTLGPRSFCTFSFFDCRPFLLGGDLKVKAILQHTTL